MYKLGFLVPDLGPTQLSYHLITELNKNLSNRIDLDIVVFFENIIQHAFQTQFCCLFMDQAWGYRDTLIATNLSTAVKLIDLPTPKQKIFYVWDLEWITLPINNKSADMLANIYQNKELKLITRSVSYAKEIQNCWNVDKVDIVKEFNIEQLLQCVNPKSQEKQNQHF